MPHELPKADWLEHQAKNAIAFTNTIKQFLIFYIFYRMQELQDENLQLQLIDTTSVFAKPINSSCHFDGSTLVYLAGAHILFHNVFQNGKQFLERVSDNEVIALAFHHSGDLTVLLVTRDTSCHVEFYFYGKKSIVVDIHQDLEILDAIFLEKKRVCLLSYDRTSKTAAILIVTTHKKIKKVDLPEKCFKLSANQRKVYILAQLGCYEMNIESEMLERKKRYETISLKNAIITDTDYDILFDSYGRCYLMQDNKNKQSFSLSQYFGKEKAQFQSAVRIGHNLLVAIKGQFVLAHFQLDQNKIEYAGKFQYNQKVRGNIVALHSSLDQMNLAVALQTTHKDQVRIEHFLFNLSALSNEKKFINPFIRLQSGGEAGQVSNLQCIIPSQIFCLTGPHIINYSYVEHIQKKHKYSIHESPRSIAVHPLGHQLLCTFETALKFYQKVEMELIETWTQSMVCSCARYTDSGLLVLCVYEDGAHNIIVYNPNSFRRIRTFTGMYLKHAVSRIDFDQNGVELILYSQKDLIIHKFKTGERLSEFREKRQIADANCIEYDPIRKWLLVACKKNIVICKKTEDYLLNFNSQKYVKMDHEVTCMHINQSAQSVFFGTVNGAILFCSYPLDLCEETVEDQRVYRFIYTTVKVHSQPLADIILTNNCKFLFTSIKGDGLSILRVKRVAGGKGGYNPFDISNYNFIETSSTPYLENVHEKLKGLLEKRKTIFNELDQFKKEWETKRIGETKGLTIDNKRKELNYVNNALGEINKYKIEHAALLQELSTFESTSNKAQAQNEKNHHKDLLACYDQNDRRKDKLHEVEAKCRNEWGDICKQCVENLTDIQGELQIKFKNFESTYLMMRQNLVNYRRRIEIEGEQDNAVREEEISSTKLRLKNEEQELYRRNNELKGDITKNRKQLERFINRKDFLQNKKRFFVEQLKYCDYEQTELIEVKESLEKQLAELENVTHKKQKRLRKYFLENQILIKYQLIHDSLTRQSNKQMEFIEQQHCKLKQNIGQLQKEILHVSQQRQKHKKQLLAKKNGLEQSKVQNQKLKQKRQFLALEVRQIEDSINATNTVKIVDEQSKNEDFLAIYQTYFVDKQLQTFLSSRETKTDELIISQNKKSQEGVKAVLQDHKQYLVSNMQLFQKYNTRVMDEINLTYLKYQTENYDLISECNVRKEQINKKKRVLHELVDQIRQTNNHIAALHNSRPIHKQSPLPAPELPFPVYEQDKQQERMELRKDKSESALWKIKKSSYQVRKMLEVQKLKGINGDNQGKVTRRIQTAVLKKKPLESSHEQGFAEQSLDVMNPMMAFLEEQKKPQTALHRYRKKQNLEAKRLFSRNKSSSKPTTCTSHTKSKQSLFV